MKKTLMLIAVAGALALSACSPEEDPDATPGEGNPTPEVTDTIDPTSGPDDNPDDTSGWSDVAFCQAVSNLSESSAEADLTAASDELSALLEDSANWDNPETIAALHAQGQAMLDYKDEVVALYASAAAEADDPEAAAAFAVLAEYMDLMFTAMGQAAVDSDSVMDYAMSFSENLDTDEFSTLTDEAMDAAFTISDYAYETCGNIY